MGKMKKIIIGKLFFILLRKNDLETSSWRAAPQTSIFFANKSAIFTNAIGEQVVGVLVPGHFYAIFFLFLFVLKIGV